MNPRTPTSSCLAPKKAEDYRACNARRNECVLISNFVFTRELVKSALCRGEKVSQIANNAAQI